MTSEPLSVVVDTSVVSRVLVGGDDPVALLYAPVLVGARWVIPLQVLAELRFGWTKNAWGPAKRGAAEKRLREHDLWLPDEAAAGLYAELRNSCHRVGHGLADKRQAGDLWVAVAAIDIGLPLITHDTVFAGTPGLTVIRRTPDAPMSDTGRPAQEGPDPRAR